MLLRAGLLLVLGALFGLGAEGSLAQSADVDAKVGEPVLLELARSERVRVIVALRQPRALASSRIAATRAVREGILSRLGPESGFRATTRWDAVSAVSGFATSGGLDRLRRDRDVLRVDLDAGGRGTDAESLPLVRGDAAHAAGLTGRGVTVAVLDSGIDRAHPDLADALVGEHCVVVPNGCPNGANEQDGTGSAADDNGHGTNVAGIVVSNGSVAPIGVAPDAAVVSVKVLDRNNGFQTTSQIVTALN